jgi:beta-glucanase (GH16 family)
MVRSLRLALVVLICAAGLGVVAAPVLARAKHHRRHHRVVHRHHRATRKSGARTQHVTQSSQLTASTAAKRGDGSTGSGTTGSGSTATSGSGSSTGTGSGSTTGTSGTTGSTPQSSQKLIFDDEFNGPSGAAPDPTKWQAVDGYWGIGNGELENYTSRTSNVALDGQGDLAITARAETNKSSTDGVTRQYTSGRLQTKGLFQFQYGALQARIQLPAGQGLWPAFWALGSNIDSVGWPACGEIDVMENLGNDPFTMYGSIHGPLTTNSNSQYGLTATEHSSTSLASGFHTYGVTWSPNSITFSLDGVAYVTRTPASLATNQAWSYNQPFYLLLNLAVGGTWPGAPDASTQFPARMLVDWVRVYQ